MGNKVIPIGTRKRIALVAHDNRKQDLLEWACYNRGTLGKHELYATGTTGRMIAEKLGLDVKRLLSGPLGGDQQVGAMISEGALDFMIFFWDPARAAAARPGRQGAAAHRRAVQHPHRLQPLDGGLRHLLPTDGRGVRAHPDRLRLPPAALTPPSPFEGARVGVSRRPLGSPRARPQDLAVRRHW